MQISSNSFYDIGTNYSIKLNDKEMLVVEEDPASRSQFEAKKAHHKKEQEEKKAQQEKESNSPQKLSEDEQRLVKALSARDSEVKAHESQHQAAGGGMVGAASYTYQQGPDGKMYAIGGEVSITTPAGSSPEETIRNAQTVIASAMAPGDPSPQDFAVATSAKVMQMKAEQQKAKQMQAAQEEKQAKEVYSSEDKNHLTLDISA